MGEPLVPMQIDRDAVERWVKTPSIGTVRAFAEHRLAEQERCARILDVRAEVSRACGGLTNEAHAVAYDYGAEAIRSGSSPEPQAEDDETISNFLFLYRHYGAAADELLAPDAIELKKKLLAAVATLSPEPLKLETERAADAEQACSLGVGCDEYGVCYADAHGPPEQCGKAETHPEPVKDTGEMAREFLRKAFEREGWDAPECFDLIWHRIAIRAIEAALNRPHDTGVSVPLDREISK